MWGRKDFGSIILFLKTALITGEISKLVPENARGKGGK